MTTKYVFENDKAIACYITTESDNEIFLDVQDDGLVKNVKRSGNKVQYEWSDQYFEEKGKGCSRYEITQFLKKLGHKIIK